MKFLNSIVQNKIATLASILVLLLLANIFTIVQDGTVKTGKFMGKISDTVYLPGPHLVNPLMSFTTINVKDIMLKLDDVSIPSQDKFVSYADFSVQFSINPSMVPELQRTFGSSDQIIDKLLEQPLQSFIREAGRNVPKAQDLFLGKVQDAMQTSIESKLRENASKYGLRIQNVFIKDIQLSEVIRSAIDKTKRLEEQVAQEQANLNKEKLVYQRTVEQEKANTTIASQKASQSKIAAEASAFKVRTSADAALYAKRQEATANMAIAKSITPQLLELKRIDVNMQRAVTWNGSVPTTVMGEKSGALPIYKLN